MDEFLAVARSLEIKELCNAVTEINNDQEDEPSTIDEDLIKQPNVPEPDNCAKQPPQERRRQIVNVDCKYECEPCQKTFYDGQTLNRHIRSKHEGVKHPCHQCDYQASYKGDLSKHIQSKHEGVKYDCDQCDYQSTQKSNLNTHIKKKH